MDRPVHPQASGDGSLSIEEVAPSSAHDRRHDVREVEAGHEGVRELEKERHPIVAVSEILTAPGIVRVTTRSAGSVMGGPPMRESRPGVRAARAHRLVPRAVPGAWRV